jgi:hypothetical protein
MSSGIEFPQRLNDLDKGSSGQAGLSLGLSGLRVFEDPPGLHDKVRNNRKNSGYLQDTQECQILQMRRLDTKNQSAKNRSGFLR